jgi:hypothetical protein
MVEGREPPIILQETKNSVSWPFPLEAKVQRPSLSKMSTWHYFLTEAMNSRGKFGSDRNGNPNYGREVVNFVHKKKKPYKILAVRWGVFWARNKMGCSFYFRFGLGLWRLHIVIGRRLKFQYLIGYFQPISLDSQQSLTIQSHSLSTWTLSLKLGSKNTAFTPSTLASAEPSWQMTWHGWKVEVLSLKHRPSHRYLDMRQ